MTEYDYSPGARERFQKKMLKIAQWRDETNSSPVANPFSSSDAVTMSRMTSTSSRQRSSSSATYYSRPTPTRSNTLPSKHSSGSGHHRDRDRDHHRHDSRRHKSSSKSSSRHTERVAPARSQTYHVPTPSYQHAQPVRSKTLPPQPNGYMVYESGRAPVHLPPGGTYMPSNGRTPGYVVPPSAPATPAGQQPYFYYPSQSPSVLKKITGFFGVNSSKSKKGSRRRSW